MALKFRLRCGDCGEKLYADDYLVPAENQMYMINFEHVAYQCDCGHIGHPIVEEVDE